MTIRLVAIAGAESGLMVDPASFAREPNVSRGTPVSVVEVNGPLVSGEDCWWGGVSIPTLGARVEELAASGMNILLDIDSPGGDVSGLVELCDVIAAARQRVSVKAYVRGMCASAAYWVATQCESVECSPTAIVGQIGAQVVIYDPPAADEHHGVRVVITSTGSERKNAAASEDGAQYQALVDNAAAEFVRAVARGRGVTEDVVRAQFGHGALLPAPEALRLGMVDAVRVAAGGEEMAKLKAEDMAAPAGPATLEDALKLIEELQRQLADKAAELDAACKPEAEVGTDVPDSPVEPMPDPEKDELKARVAQLELRAAVDRLIDQGRLEPGRRTDAEKAYRLQSRAVADPELKALAGTAFDDFVARLPAVGALARVTAANPEPPKTYESLHARAMAECGGNKAKYGAALARIVAEEGKR